MKKTNISLISYFLTVLFLGLYINSHITLSIIALLSSITLLVLLGLTSKRKITVEKEETFAVLLAVVLFAFFYKTITKIGNDYLFVTAILIVYNFLFSIIVKSLCDYSRRYINLAITIIMSIGLAVLLTVNTIHSLAYFVSPVFYSYVSIIFIMTSFSLIRLLLPEVVQVK